MFLKMRKFFENVEKILDLVLIEEQVLQQKKTVTRIMI